MLHTYSKIGVIVVTTGLLYSRTAETLTKTTKGFRVKYFFSHKGSKDQALIELAREALDDKTLSHIFFVNNDVLMPPHTLQVLLNADKDIAFYNYPYDETGTCIVTYDNKGRMTSFGVGCALFKREALEKLIKGSRNPFTVVQDNLFGIREWLDCDVKEIDETIGKMKLVQLGKSISNHGQHKIEHWNKVKRRWTM